VGTDEKQQCLDAFDGHSQGMKIFWPKLCFRFPQQEEDGIHLGSEILLQCGRGLQDQDWMARDDVCLKLASFRIGIK